MTSSFAPYAQLLADASRRMRGDYEETLPLLAGGRERAIVVVCRSSNRSLLAADVMQRMGLVSVAWLKTGVRGWNDIPGQSSSSGTSAPSTRVVTRCHQLVPGSLT